MSGKVYCISISDQKGTKKRNITEALLVENFGITGDAHAGSARQVSLLAFEAFDEVRDRVPDIKPGDFAENITTQGIDLSSVQVGDSLYIGDGVRLIVTRIGKECHHDCPIMQAVGDCIMPRLGIFASIVKGGMVRVGDKISRENSGDRV